MPELPRRCAVHETYPHRFVPTGPRRAQTCRCGAVLGFPIGAPATMCTSAMVERIAELTTERDTASTTAVLLAQQVKSTEADRARLAALLDAERGIAGPEGWSPAGGLLREWRRVYPGGTHGRVKADGRWWVGKLGLFDPLGDSGMNPVTYAEGPAGLKFDGMKAADAAVKERQ